MHVSRAVSKPGVLWITCMCKRCSEKANLRSGPTGARFGRPVTCARVTRVTCARPLACHLSLCPCMCLKSRQGHTLGHLSRKCGPVTCARLSVLMCGRARG